MEAILILLVSLQLSRAQGNFRFLYTQYPLKELEFLGAPSLTGREVIPGFCWTSVELFPKTPLHGFSMLAGLPYNMVTGFQE